MKHALLLAPHPNPRYDAELVRLCEKELSAIAHNVGIAAPIERERVGGLPLFTVEGALTDRQRSALLRCSSALSLFALKGDSLTPLMEGHARSAFYDMPAILKYKGKTNERFTRLLLNLAVFSSSAEFDRQLTVLDPLCGKGTTLFCALSAGYDGLGVELDEKEVAEAVNFAKAYLKNGRFKHDYEKSSATIRGKPAGVIHRFFTAEHAEEYKAGAQQTLKIARGDSGNAPLFFKKTPADVLIADLPYGVQHKSDGGKKGQGNALGMLHRLLPRWREALKPGGAVALSFNAYTLKKEDVLLALQRAGFSPVEERWGAGLSHWVEQAVLRDVALARY